MYPHNEHLIDLSLKPLLFVSHTIPYAITMCCSATFLLGKLAFSWHICFGLGTPLNGQIALLFVHSLTALDSRCYRANSCCYELTLVCASPTPVTVFQILSIPKTTRRDLPVESRLSRQNPLGHKILLFAGLTRSIPLA